MRPAAGRRGEDGRNRKRDLLIAHVPSLFPNHQRHCSKCHCVHVCVCVHTRTTCTQSHINYNQIGYWSHTRSQYWSSVYRLAEGHETLSPESGGTERVSNISQRRKPLQSCTCCTNDYIHSKQSVFKPLVEGPVVEFWFLFAEKYKWNIKNGMPSKGHFCWFVSFRIVTKHLLTKSRSVGQH